MTQVFFSIVIPTYNRAHLLGKALQSVQEQTFKDWECIVVDDGSTDNTNDIVKQFAQADKRFRYIFQGNAERSAARNNGINHSNGKYICFLDSDDFFLRNRLELLHNEIYGKKIKAAWFTGFCLYKGRGIVKEVRIEPCDNVFDTFAKNAIHSQQSCIDASILKEHQFNPELRIGEDFELWLRISAQFPVEFLKLQSNVAIVDHEDRSVNYKKFNSAFDELKTLKYCFKKNHPGYFISEKVKKEKIGGAHFKICLHFIYNNVRFKAAKHCLQSIASDFKSKQLRFRLNVLLKLVLFYRFKEINKIIAYEIH